MWSIETGALTSASIIINVNNVLAIEPLHKTLGLYGAMLIIDILIKVLTKRTNIQNLAFCAIEIFEVYIYFYKELLKEVVKTECLHIHFYRYT